MSILILDDPSMKELNRRFRGRDSTTDVLSFPIGKDIPNEDLPHLFGDVVISFDRAKSQAAERNVCLEEEVNHLLVHGILHLLGFDHETKKDAKIMEAEERRLWTLINQKIC